MAEKEKHWEDDDGRTIADMSQVKRPSLFGNLPGSVYKREEKPEEQETRKAAPWVDDSLSKQDRHAFFLGTMKASLLIGAAYLFYKKVITWHIPAAFIGTFAVCYLLKTGFDVNATLAQLLSGGLILGAFFMATDYSSSPATAKGKIVFGIGCGLLLFIFRACKKTPAEWCSYAILLMNVCSPLIERVTGNKSFGEVKK